MTSTGAHADATLSLKPFKIDLASKVPHLKTLLTQTRLPAKTTHPDLGPEKGIELDVLTGLKEEWLTSYDWDAEQAKLNEWVST